MFLSHRNSLCSNLWWGLSLFFDADAEALGVLGGEEVGVHASNQFAEHGIVGWQQEGGQLVADGLYAGIGGMFKSLAATPAALVLHVLAAEGAGASGLSNVCRARMMCVCFFISSFFLFFILPNGLT